MKCQRQLLDKTRETKTYKEQMKGKQNPNSVQYLRLTDYALLTFSFGYCLKINSNFVSIAGPSLSKYQGKNLSC